LEGREKFSAYAESDLYLLPSWMEGCPTTVVEALGSGLFVLATAVGALPEIIHDRGMDGNGLFVNVRDACDLASKLAWTLDHLDHIRARRLAIQTEALARFEAAVVTAKLACIYRSLLNGTDRNTPETVTL